MKYTNEVIINLPVNKVVELFDNTENLKKWQPGLESLDHISGTPGEPGAKSKLFFKMGKREVEMVETITSKNLPQVYSFIDEAKGVYNVVRNSFIPENDQSTRYLTENEFRFSGFMKLMGFLMPGMFKKQSQKYLVYFKEFAEKEVA